jgi:hypothetical protein
LLVPVSLPVLLPLEELGEDEPDVPELEEPLEGSVDPLVPEVEPLVPPLMDELPLVEPEAPGVALLVAEPGVVSVELLEELGEDGVELVVAEGLVEVLLAPVLLRSQPVTAAVATASTATRGMSLFMTSPFDCVVELGRIPRGAGCFATNEWTHARGMPAGFPPQATRRAVAEWIYCLMRGNPFPRDREFRRFPPARVGPGNRLRR